MTTVGSFATSLCSFGTAVHFAEQIEIVVAGAAVGAQADRNAQPQHGRELGAPRGQLHIAFRTGNHLGPGGGQKIELGLVEVNCVDTDGAFVEQAKRIQVAPGGHAGGLPYLRHFRFGFGEMDEKWGTKAHGKRFGPGKGPRAAGIGRVAEKSRSNKLVCGLPVP